ncbi:MAG: C4-dicarboxylate ABC transporter, partial [Burkholderiaceae bacterium]
QIYWGAVPFVVIQIIMVTLVIAFPGLVTGALDRGPKVDVDKIRIEIPASPDYEQPSTPQGPQTPKDESSEPAQEEDAMKAILRSLEGQKK